MNLENSLNDSGSKCKDTFDDYKVYVLCGGKCGSSTLNSTFNKNNLRSIHLHSMSCYQKRYNKKNDLHCAIYNSCKTNGKIYVIDSYRTPIERKISSFFSNIQSHLPLHKNLQIEEIIDIFNKSYLNNLEEYHSINYILDHYNINRFTEFNFEKKYNLIEKDNKIFIKILFKDISNWDKILSEIFQKKITIHSDNLTTNKSMNDLYKKFKEKYKVPKTYLENQLINDVEFKIYNTKEEQEKYIKKWMENSF
jgi:hypothetical protein